LLKADQGEAGEGWSDERSRHHAMVARVREKLVSEGLDAVLTRKKRETPPIEPKFDGSAKRSSSHWPTRNRRPAMPRWTTWPVA